MAEEFVTIETTSLLKTVNEQTTPLLQAVSDQAKALQASAQALQSSSASQEKLVVLVEMVLQLLRTERPLYSAEDSLINKQTNWFCSAHMYHPQCHICKYYGHGIESCPNITKSATGYCIRCWEQGHNTTTCLLNSDQQVRPPFKNNFLYPHDLLLKLVSSLTR